jgi:hypothetical protein
MKPSAARAAGPVTAIWLSSARGRVAVLEAAAPPAGDDAPDAGPPQGRITVREGPVQLITKHTINPEGGAPVHAACFSQRGTELITGGGDGQLIWWQVENGQQSLSAELPRGEDAEPGPSAITALAGCKAGFLAAASGRSVRISGVGRANARGSQVLRTAAACRGAAWHAPPHPTQPPIQPTPPHRPFPGPPALPQLAVRVQHPGPALAHGQRQRRGGGRAAMDGRVQPGSSIRQPGPHMEHKAGCIRGEPRGWRALPCPGDARAWARSGAARRCWFCGCWRGRAARARPWLPRGRWHAHIIPAPSTGRAVCPAAAALHAGACHPPGHKQPSAPPPPSPLRLALGCARKRGHPCRPPPLGGGNLSPAPPPSAPLPAGREHVCSQGGRQGQQAGRVAERQVPGSCHGGQQRAGGWPGAMPFPGGGGGAPPGVLGEPPSPHMSGCMAAAGGCRPGCSCWCPGACSWQRCIWARMSRSLALAGACCRCLHT